MIESRVEQWKRKLLDLTLRNPLLNARDSSRFLLLQEGEVLAQAAGSRSVVPYAPPEAGEPLPFKFKLPEKELRGRLEGLYATSRSMYEDSGVNQLFVATIARGKQLICVGDPKQLQPTAFFMRGDASDDDPDVATAATDLESILDECLANGLHSGYLNWHYRSRHEALIAFSNRRYYDDRLNTFPAAETNDRLGVSFQFVEGAVYDHATHANAGEAKALVEFLYERLQGDSSERKRSWGVVTFSVAQKKLIEKTIEERFAGVPWADEFFSDSKPDAFFVKNLENVQGDERDVIVFSIAYAPDAQGDFAMRFGPINNPGGERRLNVAATRAREQVIVFASAHASAIRAEKTNSVGVKHLKALMEYAETGVLEGDGPKDPSVRSPGIVGDVRGFLESKGYVVDEKVGRSAMPVDLAVRDPDDMDRYALAIEFDGPAYAAQNTVRDRDVLRPAVLARLGWKCFRLWSVDWAFDRKRIQERLLAALPPIERSQAEDKQLQTRE